MSEPDASPESVVRSAGSAFRYVFGGGFFGLGIFALVAVAEYQAEPQRVLAVATLDRLRVGDPTASAMTRDDLASALAGLPSSSREGLEIVRRASSFVAGWNTTVSWGERCVEVDAYAPSGRTRLYVPMREDATVWVLTAILTEEPDWGPCSSD
ncbi:MAG: hypothetical protein J0L92_02300 [Deltaproteobacteria bacterium]|nr:hypothetical protein [Deltaproteobacteria bacterium]